MFPKDLHTYYINETSALYKSMGDSGFAPEMDRFARELVFGLWHCQKLSEAHADAINALYSKNQPRPSYLYWELVTECARDRSICVPDFYRVQTTLDQALGRDVCEQLIDFFRSLLLKLCTGEDMNAETAYINAVAALLKKASAARDIMSFNETLAPAGRPSEPVTLLSSKEPTTDFAPVTSTPAKTAPPPEKVEDLLAELDTLVGMEQIKKDVRSLINLIKVRKLRAENGLAVPDLSLHMVFTGNPGTGKTTVARLLARLYHSIGVLAKGTLVEVDRSGLVAGYVGQTAIKTKEAIDKAMGGILFIDEAYALAPEGGSGSDFGKEAIETILKAMEDERDELVVIAAGYPEPMERFISSNPGLESRFGKYFHFNDYNGAELFEIFKSQCKRNQYEPNEAALIFAENLFRELYENRDENFGNARDVRNIFEKAIARHSDRVAALEAPTLDDLLTLIESDLAPDAE